MFLRRSVRQALQVGVIVIAALAFTTRSGGVLDNMSGFAECTVFFFTPGLITVYGCDMAGLVVPASSGTDHHNGLPQAYSGHPPRSPPASESRVSSKSSAEKRQEDSLKNLLTYWQGSRDDMVVLVVGDSKSSRLEDVDDATPACPWR